MIKHTEIDQKELRVGNMLEYFLGEEEEWIKCVIDAQDIYNCAEHWTEFSKHHRRVPLSEEWLVRAGFTPNEPENAWWINEYEDFLIAVKDGKFYYASWDGHDLNYIVEIEHVHRLQNLFFEINRVELKFKDL